MPDKPYVHCVFAEDVRQETSGQCSIIGAFQTGIRLPSFPCYLPKIAVHADLVAPIGDTPHDMQVWLKFDEQTIQAIPVPIETIQQSQKEAEAYEGAESFCLRMAIIATPLAVAAPGKLRLEIRYGDVILRSNALTIDMLAQ